MHTLRRIALALVIIGAINWGLIGLFQFDLVAAIFGGQNAGFSRIVYTLVGVSGLVSLGLLFDPITDNSRTNIRRSPNYGTEFGEEFGEEYDFDRDDI